MFHDDTIHELRQHVDALESRLRLVEAELEAARKVVEAARCMCGTIDKVLAMTGQDLVVTVDGARMKLDATGECKAAIAAYDALKVKT